MRALRNVCKIPPDERRRSGTRERFAFAAKASRLPLPACVKARRAFTILELLVAASITALLAGFIINLVANVTGMWTRTSGRLATETQARLVLDQLALDLSSARFQDDGNVWFAANIVNATSNSGLWVNALTANNVKPNNANSLVLGSANLSDDRFGLAGVWLRFFTTSRGSNTLAAPTTASAPVAVGYQIIRRFTSTNPNSLTAAYLLHRSEVRPTAINSRIGTLEAGFNITTANYTTSSSAT